jgi:hypothetical protein
LHEINDARPEGNAPEAAQEGDRCNDS